MIAVPRPFCLFLSALAALLPAPAASQAGDALATFRYTMALTPDTQQGLVSLRLPRDVYLHARSPDLNDVRLFDANGNPVPFALHVPVGQPHLQRNTTPAIVFPVHAVTAPGKQADLDIQTSANGSLLAVKPRGESKKPGAKPSLQSLIMDLQPALASGGTGSNGGKNKPLIDGLQFTLPASVSQYSAQVWLEASDDLQHWDTIGTTHLTWRQTGDAPALSNDKLEFEPRRFRYARLTWRKGEPLEFTAITANTVIQIASPPTTETMEIQPEAGKAEHDLLYRAALAIPVESLNLQFVEPNIILPATVGRYLAMPNQPPGTAALRFAPIRLATFYQIRQNDLLRQSAALVLPVTHNTEWVIRPQQPTDSKPVLQISWQPASLIFVTSGQPPYRLAFGRDHIGPGATELARVAPDFSIAELPKLEQLNPGPLQQNTTAASTGQNRAALATSTKHGLLWALAGLGVLVLGGIAWRLARQRKQQAN